MVIQGVSDKSSRIPGSSLSSGIIQRRDAYCYYTLGIPSSHRMGASIASFKSSLLLLLMELVLVLCC